MHTPERVALRRRWADVIRRVYDLDPLVCPGGEMRVVGFIHRVGLIKRILDHLVPLFARWGWQRPSACP